MPKHLQIQKPPTSMLQIFTYITIRWLWPPWKHFRFHLVCCSFSSSLQFVSLFARVVNICNIDEGVFWFCRCFLNLQVFCEFAGVFWVCKCFLSLQVFSEFAGVFWVCRGFGICSNVFSEYAGALAFACVMTLLGHRKIWQKVTFIRLTNCSFK